MSKAGRPRALDETKRREVCALVTAGASVRRAAQYVGCSHSTICREAQRDEEFRGKLERAKATTQLAPLQAMRQAAQSDWRAAAWMLERSDPDQYGRSYRRAFGLKELRALARDLMAIFSEEIDHPLLRDRVAKRVQATINYAMRHAWDKQRSGKALNQAMDYFAKKEEGQDMAGMLDFSLHSLAGFHENSMEPEGNIAAREGQEFAKPEFTCGKSGDENARNSASAKKPAA